jgi:hypothetical protein
MNSTAKAINWSAAKKKSIAMTAKTRTITDEIMVSRRVGQVTFAVSALTCCRKVKGLVVFDAMCRFFLPPSVQPEEFLDFRYPETPCRAKLNRESRYVQASN